MSLLSRVKQNIDPPGMVINPSCGEMNTGRLIFPRPSPFAPENMVSQGGFGCPFPRQPAHAQHPDLNLISLAGRVLCIVYFAVFSKVKNGNSAHNGDKECGHLGAT